MQLFGPSEHCDMQLSSCFWPREMVLSEEDKDSLTKPFDMKETEHVIMEMRDNSAPSPNGFGISFFKKFWHLIKGDVFTMFKDFEEE